MTEKERHKASHKGALIVFTRYPEPGKSKTRLIGAIGSEKAARLQFHMLRKALKAAEKVFGRDEIIICLEGGTMSGLQALIGSGWLFSRQAEGDLGQKMLLALCSAGKNNPGPVVLIGSDCPDISPDILRQAFAILKDRDMVLGPAADGGFYMLGINGSIERRLLEYVMTGIDWGTPLVLKQALQRIQEAGLSCGFTAELHDVDRPEDLPDDLSPLFAPDCSRISVIVPALNEEECIASTLDSINRGDNIQVILADGGSRDRTLQIAEDLGAEIVNSGRGRSCQMNEGAGRAEGEILLFVHADTRMPFLYDWYVRGAIVEGRYVGGGFRFSLDQSFPGSAGITLLVNLRSRLLGMPYGDQALFIDGKLFRSMGGYDKTPILEDVKLVTQMNKKGRIVTLPAAVKTSSRRWREKGLFKTTFINQLIMCGYYLGISVDSLASLYKK
ncbi:MAG: TIGR04283 family arsenosugar biosynthesis glycosyltransferase [Thermodesulfobacteriota bacterium]